MYREIYGFGLESCCKECRRVYFALRHKLKRYGLTLKKFKQMLEEQKNRCAICGEEFIDVFSSLNRDFHTYFMNTPRVDHDHKTGKIRGLLCHFCNNLIGELGAREDIFISISSIHYFKRNNKN